MSETQSKYLETKRYATSGGSADGTYIEGASGTLAMAQESVALIQSGFVTDDMTPGEYFLGANGESIDEAQPPGGGGGGGGGGSDPFVQELSAIATEGDGTPDENAIAAAEFVAETFVPQTALIGEQVATQSTFEYANEVILGDGETSLGEESTDRIQSENGVQYIADDALNMPSDVFIVAGEDVGEGDSAIRDSEIGTTLSDNDPIVAGLIYTAAATVFDAGAQYMKQQGDRYYEARVAAFGEPREPDPDTGGGGSGGGEDPPPPPPTEPPEESPPPQEMVMQTLADNGLEIPEDTEVPGAEEANYDGARAQSDNSVTRDPEPMQQFFNDNDQVTITLYGADKTHNPDDSFYYNWLSLFNDDRDTGDSGTGIVGMAATFVSGYPGQIITDAMGTASGDPDSGSVFLPTTGDVSRANAENVSALSSQNNTFNMTGNLTDYDNDVPDRSDALVGPSDLDVVPNYNLNPTLNELAYREDGGLTTFDQELGEGRSISSTAYEVEALTLNS